MIRKQTRIQLQCLLIAVLLTVSFFGVFNTGHAAEKGTAKNVILLIPDGMGASYMTATRIYKGEPVSFERYLKGLMRTYSNDTQITDSAAAGTAMATGYKTNNGVISVTPDGTMPDSILDAARIAGKGTGLVSTTRVTHATPAVFTAHDPSRGNEAGLALEYISNVDVILGGGRDMFLLEADGGRQTERNLVQEAIDAGYDYITARSEMASVQSDKVLGLFAMSDLGYDADRTTEIPSLKEMTELAIEALSQNDNGFFLMVEGSLIDWAGHANDPVASITDTLAFEAAVEAAIEFARQDGETLVVVVADHETGGWVIGSTPGGYEENIQVLKTVQGTTTSLARALISEAETVQLQDVKQVDGQYYAAVRSAAAALGGEVSWNPDSYTAGVHIGGQTVEISTINKTISYYGVVQPANLFVEEGTTYVHVNEIGNWLNVHVGTGTSSSQPDQLTLYLVNFNQILEPLLGFALTDHDVELLSSINWISEVAYQLGTVLSNHALVSWGTRHHSAVEVPVYAYGVGAEEFVGVIDNTELPRIISYLMGTELFENEETFVEQLRIRRSE